MGGNGAGRICDDSSNGQVRSMAAICLCLTAFLLCQFTVMRAWCTLWRSLFIQVTYCP